MHKVLPSRMRVAQSLPHASGRWTFTGLSPTISKPVGGVILVVIMACFCFCLLPNAHADADVYIVEKHVGGYSVYCVRNSGLTDCVVEVSYTERGNSNHKHLQVPVPALSFSSDITTSQDSTRPVILSVQVAPTPTPTP